MRPAPSRAPRPWTDPAQFAKAVTQSYRRNKWETQPVRIEVWSEKGTVRGTLALILDKYEIPFRVMHGFASATTVQEIASESIRSPRPLVALYVGDWDPSGLHMSEADLPGRLAEYRERLSLHGEAGPAFEPEILRLALDAEDVADPELPSFALDTKRRDPRHGWYGGPPR